MRDSPVRDNLPIPVEAITQSITKTEPCIRDTALQYFLAEVKKTDGKDYPSASLYQLFVALQGQIRLSDPSVNLLTQPTYVKCRESKMSRTHLKSGGKHLVGESSHRSNAVRSYTRTANIQQNESSEILYGKKQKTTTCTETKLQSDEEKSSHDSFHQVVNIESVRRESVAEPTTLSFTFNIKL
ncbi:unnamed protein product [Mytilus coruscus]|uniref:Uncharacterized protein n=1 Tax=Mytilus coruscus TaxID=42192 RepID=A0A6J8C1L7_MYTCO|nr:unnamed protein product [Mytilus coruscus]